MEFIKYKALLLIQVFKKRVNVKMSWLLIARLAVFLGSATGTLLMGGLGNILKKLDAK